MSLLENSNCNDDNDGISDGSSGDIWSSMGALSFASPMKDLLDTGTYTIDDLLAEDELLQELRGMHPQLVDFFSNEKSITTLLQYLSTPKPSFETWEKSQQQQQQQQKKGENNSNEEVAEEDSSKEHWMYGKFTEENSTKIQNMSLQELYELKFIRFPYMACEVICCDIASILEILVQGTSTSSEKMSLLDLLFQMLISTEHKIDDRRAGYLEKITTLLLRKCPEPMKDYLNKDFFEGSIHCHGGSQLMRCMFHHLHSFSIMQILQRLLLRPPPASTPDEEEEEEDDMDDDEPMGMIQCNWSDNPNVIQFLIERLNGTSEKNTSSAVHIHCQEKELNDIMNSSEHACEILITIIQNSTLTSNFLKTLTSGPMLRQILNPIFSSPIIMAESIMTTSMNVLEILILQLGGFGGCGTNTEEERQNNLQKNEDNNKMNGNYNLKSHNSTTTSIKDDEANAKINGETNHKCKDAAKINNEGGTEATADSLILQLPELLKTLCGYLLDEETNKWTGPVPFSSSARPLLGTLRLRIIRLMESLVLYNHPKVDQILCQSDLLKVAWDLFWQFPWCTMLHQSVANSMVHILEGNSDRLNLQMYILQRCNLMESLMSSFVHAVDSNQNSTPGNTEFLLEMKNSNVENATPSIEAERGSNDSNDIKDSDFIIPVSDDDVDAALEQQQQQEQEILESKSKEEYNTKQNEQNKNIQSNGTNKGDLGKDVFFRPGYMGHVIIICQALVHACGMDTNTNNKEENDVQKQQNDESCNQFVDIDMNDSEPNGDAQIKGQPESHSNTATTEPIEKEEETNEKNGLFDLVSSLPIYPSWLTFVSSSLAAETELQAAPLGGYNIRNTNMIMENDEDNIANLRSFLQESNNVEEDDDILLSDLNQTPQQRQPASSTLVSPYMSNGSIDLDDNELEIAASMMEALSFQSKDETNETSSSGRHHRQRRVMGGSMGGAADFGTVIQTTTTQQQHYYYDDPLGNPVNDISHQSEDISKQQEDCDEDEDEDDVPVMDLFAGNFNFQESSTDNKTPDFDGNVVFNRSSDHTENHGNDGDAWADFANFDDAFANKTTATTTTDSLSLEEDISHDFVAKFDDTDIDLFAEANSADIIDASTDFFGTSEEVDLFGPDEETTAKSTSSTLKPSEEASAALEKQGGSSILVKTDTITTNQ